MPVPHVPVHVPREVIHPDPGDLTGKFEISGKATWVVVVVGAVVVVVVVDVVLVPSVVDASVAAV